MAKDDEVDKAHGRGQELTPDEIALEDARDLMHANRGDQGVIDAFKAAQQRVVAARVSERQAREAAGPPPGATDVVRDASGRAVGWNEGPDAAVAPGGVA
jgi:hypothetical protein